MEKTKVGYNTYYNERLKKVDFHGVETYPVYVTINYQKKSIFFKSYCFELFAGSRYGRSIKDKDEVPTLENVVKCETKLLELIIDSLGEKLVLKEFKNYYDLNCKDLCTETADGFLVYVFLFFSQNDASTFANVLSIGAKDLTLYNVLQEMEVVIQHGLYQKIIDGSIKNGQPYLPIYKYALSKTNFPLPYFPIISWKNKPIRKQFLDFLSSNYTEDEIKDISKNIKSWVNKLASKI